MSDSIADVLQKLQQAAQETPGRQNHVITASQGINQDVDTAGGLVRQMNDQVAGHLTQAQHTATILKTEIGTETSKLSDALDRVKTSLAALKSQTQTDEEELVKELSQTSTESAAFDARVAAGGDLLQKSLETHRSSFTQFERQLHDAFGRLEGAQKTAGTELGLFATGVKAAEKQATDDTAAIAQEIQAAARQLIQDTQKFADACTRAGQGLQKGLQEVLG